MRVSIDIIAALGAAGLAGFAASGFLYLLAGLISFAYVQEAGVAMKARRFDVTRRLMAGAALVAEASGGTTVNGQRDGRAWRPAPAEKGWRLWFR